MPIFDEVAKPHDLWPATAPWPRRRAELLLSAFRVEFPEIQYDLLWGPPIVNAQAFHGSQGPAVRLYGGLGRHRMAGIEALALALAHETGHHLGGPPSHPLYKSISSEEQADAWAMGVALPRLFGRRRAEKFVETGRRQLGRIVANWMGPASYGMLTGSFPYDRSSSRRDD
jgi:hypothetical protein